MIIRKTSAPMGFTFYERKMTLNSFYGTHLEVLANLFSYCD